MSAAEMREVRQVSKQELTRVEMYLAGKLWAVAALVRVVRESTPETSECDHVISALNGLEDLVEAVTDDAVSRVATIGCKEEA